MAIFAISSVGLDRTRAARLIRDSGIGGMLFTSPENVFYTTGAHTLPGTGNPILFAMRTHLPTFSFVDGEGAATLFIWLGATMGVDYEGEDVRTFVDHAGAEEELASFLEERRKEGSKFGVESSCPAWALRIVERIAGKENAILTDEIPSELRLVKSARELELIERSTRIVERAVSGLVPKLRPGISRLDLAQDARRLMMELGATAVDHLTIAFGPSNPEVMSEERLEENQLITLDLGAVVEGYVSDNRRLFYSSRPVPDETRRLHGTLVGIVDSVGEALRPGAPFSDVYSLAVNLYERGGLQPLFFHVGHSIGIQTEEAWISAESGLKVQENMVLNIELYAPDESGVMVGDEETYAIGSSGSRRITTSPREIGTVWPSNP